MLYEHPQVGKVGVISHVSKNLVFGICADTKKEARARLREKVGYNDSLKYRWGTCIWTDINVKEWEVQRKEHEEYLADIRALREEQRIKLEIIKNNIHLLPEHLQIRMDTACYDWRSGSCTNHAYNTFINFLRRK